MRTLAPQLLLLFVACCLSCSKQGSLGRAGDDQSVRDVLEQAASEFSALPRTRLRVLAAYQQVSQVVDTIRQSGPTRYAALAQAAKYANWLAYHSQGAKEIAKFASAALRHCEKAIRMNSDRVEGVYYRAIAAGLAAEQNKLQARGAMTRIRDDALKAIKLDPTYAFGGPHRLLGALYLRAPGPPAGIGSLRRADGHLKKAMQIAPTYPENLLFMAEAHIKAKRPSRAQELIDRVLASTHPAGEFSGPVEWREQALELRRTLDK